MTHVTFIHGIGNKPPADELLDLWKGTLADHGLDLDAQGVSSQMVYWADLLYPAPLEEAQYEAAETQVQQQEVPEIGLRWVVEAQGDEARFIASLAGTIGYEELATDAPAIEPVDVTLAEFEATGAEAAAVGFERVPIPWWLKRRLMKIFLRDVEHYLFDVDFSPRPGEHHRIQTEIRRRTIEALQHGDEQAGGHVVVSHSLGTVIAYDCLKRVGDCPAVDALLTIGSPLGLDEVQDRLRPEWSRDDGFPDKLEGRWANVFDRLDPVAGFDPDLANDFRRHGDPCITDIDEPNEGTWRHSIVKYLRGAKLRAELAAMLAAA
jgi:hypothetical protein